MAVSAIVSNHAKYSLAKKLIDLDADSLKILLMRSGFSFNKDNHATLLNIKGTLSGTTLAINAAKELTDSGNGFLTAGLVPGNSVTIAGFTEGGNNVTKVISTVTAGVIVFTNTSGLVEEAAGDSVSVTANDELATGAGYTQDTKTLANTTVTEDDTNDRCEMTCDNVTWTASGGPIGPSPGAIIYDDTAADNAIIGYLDFGGEQTATDGAAFTINNIKIRLS